MTAGDVGRTAVRHWFYLLLPMAAVAAFQFRAAVDWRSEAALGEATALFDWCVFLPAMFLLCYRRTMPPRALALRLVGLVCGGLWVAALIVPDGSERMIGAVSWLRYPGLALLLVAEAAAFVAVLRLTSGGDSDPAALQRLGVPAPVARLMLLEARFWRWVWRAVRGR